jgi:hypothetical protein
VILSTVCCYCTFFMANAVQNCLKFHQKTGKASDKEGSR